MITRLSSLQYPVLQKFVHGGYLSVEEAQEIDQRPFRSMLIRKWITYGPRGFHVTTEGRQAYEQFHHTSVLRKNPTMPLTAYFDPEAYGLQALRKRPARAQQASMAAYATA